MQHNSDLGIQGCALVIVTSSFAVHTSIKSKYIVFRLKTIPNTATFVGTLLMLNTARNATNKMKHGQTRNGHEHVKHGQRGTDTNMSNTAKHRTESGNQTRRNTVKHGWVGVRVGPRRLFAALSCLIAVSPHTTHPFHLAHPRNPKSPRVKLRTIVLRTKTPNLRWKTP